MLVRSSGSWRAVNPGTNICTGGGAGTATSRLPAPGPRRRRTFPAAPVFLHRVAIAGGPTTLGQAPVVDQDFGDVAVEEAADLRRAAQLVEPGPDADLVHADGRRPAVPLTRRLAVDVEFRPAGPGRG